MPRRPKAVLLDTNVLLRYLIGDSPGQAHAATAFMERLEKGSERAEILETVVAEAVWTLESFYAAPRTDIAAKLATVMRFRGVGTPRRRVLLNALARYGSSAVDFVDCLLAATAEHDGMVVCSFDRDFRQLGVEWSPPRV